MHKFYFFIFIFILCANSPSFLQAQTKAPEINLVTIDGKEFSLQSYLGKQTIVINFWASWCEACQEEIEYLNSLKMRYRDSNVLFLGVNAGESAKHIKSFVDQYKFSYLILQDPQKIAAKAYKVLGIPFTIVISKEGIITYQNSSPPKELESFR